MQKSSGELWYSRSEVSLTNFQIAFIVKDSELQKYYSPVAGYLKAIRCLWVNFLCTLMGIAQLLKESLSTSKAETNKGETEICYINDLLNSKLLLNQTSNTLGEQIPSFLMILEQTYYSDNPTVLFSQLVCADVFRLVVVGCLRVRSKKIPAKLVFHQSSDEMQIV
ncbi:hypothetical protein EGR_03496 [Echinococcus granulosus]|uniref:Uncharacterized protein n=1 Tax=Echinococcus granulosus TaxID=6210 RepID=W6UTI6_ECHGR|nr:hypothetical protein EGR_03496 [Echinococcus granulosus]EUB61682.1 hypothetical protein EGR_03496 [Echinococcus granulosus]